MTLPRERTNAVLGTREFRRLIDRSATPDVPEHVREEARTLLRHFPDRGDLALAHDACPHWFGRPLD
ncbi:BPSL0761 family protein [Rhizobacter sp. Root404]|uniref:BPSL0761 family protein n=1 Tax=Rhizobacter sp. Root404 TaxID=1736528 RepID=UPI0009E7BB66